MVKIADLSEGQEITASVGPMTRDAIKEYGKASRDTNAIHMSDAAAVLSKLKGVIQHGMLSYAHVMVYLDDWIADSGNLTKITCEMRGMVRPGDMLDMKFEITEISGKTVKMDWAQYSMTPIEITKDGKDVVSFEAKERDWISEKDVNRDLVKEKDLDGAFTWLKTTWDEDGFPDGKYEEEVQEYTGGGTLKYRYRLSLKGTVEFQLNE